MADSHSAGESPDNLVPRVPIVDLARIAGVTPGFLYAEARRGRAPKSKRGLTLAEATAWIKSRRAKRAARAEAVRELEAFCENLAPPIEIDSMKERVAD
jgi:hypothetical protein